MSGILSMRRGVREGGGEILDILRNYRRHILMTDSNPVHSGNNSSKSSMPFRVY